MGLSWQKCFLCKGDGKITLMNTRIKIFKKSKKKNEPLIDDETINCPICKGKGQIAVKGGSLFQPWNLHKRND